jgi:hypothetical protein
MLLTLHSRSVRRLGLPTYSTWVGVESFNRLLLLHCHLPLPITFLTKQKSDQFRIARKMPRSHLIRSCFPLLEAYGEAIATMVSMGGLFLEIHSFRQGAPWTARGFRNLLAITSIRVTRT